MPLFIRISTYVVVLAVVGLAGATFWPSALTDLGLDVWNVAELTKGMEQDRQAAEQMDIDDQTVLRRMQVKETIAAELIAGRVTLLEATAQFESLHSDDRRFRELLELYYPGDSSEERMCRCVIAFARMRVRVVGSSQESELVDKLERELAAAKGPDGRLHLPEPR